MSRPTVVMDLKLFARELACNGDIDKVQILKNAYQLIEELEREAQYFRSAPEEGE